MRVTRIDPPNSGDQACHPLPASSVTTVAWSRPKTRNDDRPAATAAATRSIIVGAAATGGAPAEGLVVAVAMDARSANDLVRICFSVRARWWPGAGLVVLVARDDESITGNQGS